MLDKIHRTIAKEIVDQTISHFKKQQWPDLAKENAKNPRTESRQEVSYEPSNNFQKIFSGIIGEKSGASENTRPENIFEHMSKISYPKNSPRSEPVDCENYEKQKEDEMSSPQIEDKQDEPPTSQVSVFQILSHEHKEEEDPSQQAESKSETKSTSTASVFQRLSHNSG